jgi:outer membrane protein OmpA-like peptidoglycan-associated protein
VAEYLEQKGVRTPEHIVVQGYGASRPVAPNDNVANLKKNRRVEITILEN